MRALLVVLLLAGCATVDDRDYACGTDTECEEQCMADLRPDENPDVCAVALLAVD